MVLFGLYRGGLSSLEIPISDPYLQNIPDNSDCVPGFCIGMCKGPRARIHCEALPQAVNAALAALYIRGFP